MISMHILSVIVRVCSKLKDVIAYPTIKINFLRNTVDIVVVVSVTL